MFTGTWRGSSRDPARRLQAMGPDVGGRVGGVADGQGVRAGDEEFGERSAMSAWTMRLRAERNLAGVVVARADEPYCPRAPSDAGDR